MNEALHTLNDGSPATGLTLTVAGRDWVFKPDAVEALQEVEGEIATLAALVVDALQATKLQRGANEIDAFGVPLIARVADDADAGLQVVIEAADVEADDTGLGYVEALTDWAHTLIAPDGVTSDNAILAEGRNSGPEGA